MQFTNPRILTTLWTLSKPISLLITDSIVMPTFLAASYASSRFKSLPTLPVISLPLASKAPWPEMYAYFPENLTLVKLPIGFGVSIKFILII